MVPAPLLALDHCLVHQSGTAGLGDYLWSLLPTPADEKAESDASGESGADEKAESDASGESGDDGQGVESDNGEEGPNYDKAYVDELRKARSDREALPEMRAMCGRGGSLPELDMHEYSFGEDELKTVVFDTIFDAVDLPSFFGSRAYPYSVATNSVGDLLFDDGETFYEQTQRVHSSLRKSKDNKRILKVIAPVFTNSFGPNVTHENVVDQCLGLSIMLGKAKLGPRVLDCGHFPVTLAAKGEDDRMQSTPTTVGLLLMENVFCHDPGSEVSPHLVSNYNDLDRELYQQAIVNLNADMHEMIARHNHFAADYLPWLIPGLPTNDLLVQRLEGWTGVTPHAVFNVWHVGVEPDSLAR
jgi:hypothetical protein